MMPLLFGIEEVISAAPAPEATGEKFTAAPVDRDQADGRASVVVTPPPAPLVFTTTLAPPPTAKVFTVWDELAAALPSTSKVPPLRVSGAAGLNWLLPP